jgi:hypothetical protein
MLPLSILPLSILPLSIQVLPFMHALLRVPLIAPPITPPIAPPLPPRFTLRSFHRIWLFLTHAFHKHTFHRTSLPSLADNART